MWNTTRRAGVATLALALAAMGCSERDQTATIAGPESSTDAKVGSTIHTQVGPTYVQIEELGNPLVSEVTIVKARHPLYDRTMPYNTAEFRPETEAFIRSFGRPASLATLLGSVLYPDILIVDTSKDRSTAGYLSWALANGWGGRTLADDVVDISLTAVFSSLLASEGAKCAPFQLPLCTDNVSVNDVPNLLTFPYVAPPST